MTIAARAERADINDWRTRSRQRTRRRDATDFSSEPMVRECRRHLMPRGGGVLGAMPPHDGHIIAAILFRAPLIIASAFLSAQKSAADKAFSCAITTFLHRVVDL